MKDLGNHWVEPDCCDEWLWMLWAVGCDYDGMDGSIETMKQLVDELVDMASKARKCLHDGLLFPKENDTICGDGKKPGDSMTDVVPVVRCKDCRYFEDMRHYTGLGWCKEVGDTRSKDWYCADGKRRE